MSRLIPTTYRRGLRQNGTPAERRLWRALRNRQLRGFKFRRQVTLGAYVVDFYCAEARLAIELDGSVHDDPARRDYDAQRQANLESLSLRVLRFSNDAVREQLPVVLDAIAFALMEQQP
ncbi:MAG: endonuclease domain-containing protein [Bacteroidota bacterium]